MNFRIYATRHTCLVVPECMQAPQAASDRFGPLEFLGDIPQGDIAAEDVARILGDIDAASFAIVPEHLAEQLRRVFADEHA